MAFAGETPFLSDTMIEQANDILQLDDAATASIHQAARIVRDHPALQRLALHCRDRFKADDGRDFRTLRAELAGELEAGKQTLARIMGDQSGMFAALVILLMLPETIQRYRSRGIPLQILRDTMGDLSLWMYMHLAKYGVFGLDQFDWLLHHVSGRLFRLGRLQFAMATFRLPYRVHRQQQQGKIVVLSEAGIVYRQDGRVDGTNGRFEREQGWTSEWVCSADEEIGCLISRAGLALHEKVRLDRSEWRLLLGRGDSVLDIHIPEGGGLSPALCQQSLAAARDFYKAYFPEQSFQAFVCTSWLMDSQLQDILPESSNIVGFQKMFHLLPVKSDECETYERVFGSRTIDLRNAPRDTRLRRSILSYVEGGGHLHAASGFLLKHDLTDGEEGLS